MFNVILGDNVLKEKLLYINYIIVDNINVKEKDKIVKVTIPV